MDLDIKKEVAIPVITGVVSFGVGVAAGYLFKRYRDIVRIRKDIEEIAEDQLKLQFQWDETKRETNKNLQSMNRVLTKMQDYEPVVKLQLSDEAQEELGHTKERHPTSKGGEWEQIEQVVSEPMSSTTFDGREIDPNWDYDIEVANRSSDHPYIIHRDEFFSNEMDLEQSTITYYAGDNVLVDEEDVPIPTPEKIVGQLQFGHGSLDPSICYVRNEKIAHEWEVIIDHGTFAEEVLGVSAENKLGSSDLKHSVPKFRRE